MIAKIIQFLIKYGFVSLIITALITLGTAIVNNLSWSFLTTFFILIQNLLNMLNWIIDVPSLILLIGITLSIEVAYWTYEAWYLIVKFFKTF